MITAKIQCQSKTESGEGDARQVVVTFVPDYADGRNKEWSLYTPALSLSMTLKGAVADRFEPVEAVCADLRGVGVAVNTRPGLR